MFCSAFQYWDDIVIIANHMLSTGKLQTWVNWQAALGVGLASWVLFKFMNSCGYFGYNSYLRIDLELPNSKQMSWFTSWHVTCNRKNIYIYIYFIRLQKTIQYKLSDSFIKYFYQFVSICGNELPSKTWRRVRATNWWGTQGMISVEALEPLGFMAGLSFRSEHLCGCFFKVLVIFFFEFRKILKSCLKLKSCFNMVEMAVETRAWELDEIHLGRAGRVRDDRSLGEADAETCDKRLIVNPGQQKKMEWIMFFLHNHNSNGQWQWSVLINSDAGQWWVQTFFRKRSWPWLRWCFKGWPYTSDADQVGRSCFFFCFFVDGRSMLNWWLIRVHLLMVYDKLSLMATVSCRLALPFRWQLWTDIFAQNWALQTTLVAWLS